MTAYLGALEIWLRELPSLPTVKWYLRVPFNLNYWQGLPNEKNPYVCGGGWHRGAAALLLHGDACDRLSAPGKLHHRMRAVALVEQLRDASEALIAVIERIEPERWVHVPAAGVWSPSKDAEHVAEGAAYHQWIVRLSLGQRVGARPGIERGLVIAQRSQREVVDLPRRTTEEGALLVGGLSDQQLDLPAPATSSAAASLALTRVQMAGQEGKLGSVGDPAGVVTVPQHRDAHSGRRWRKAGNWLGMQGS